MRKLIFLLFTLVCFPAFSQCENDTINPWFDNFNPEPTVNCGTDLSTISPIAYDDCDTLVEVYSIDIYTTHGDCPGVYEIFRVYRGFDDSGNGVIETQIIHIVDESGPEFTNITSDIISTCGDIEFSTPIVSDNCSDFNLTSEIITDSISPCNYTKTKIWTAFDQCGNGNSISQTITVEDNLPPIITGQIEVDLLENSNLDTIMIVANDNCSEVDIIYTDLEVSGNNIIRTYTVTDQCGNVSTFVQIIKLIEESQRVAICHREGNGSYHTIWVAPQAVQAHLNRVDYLGPCQEYLIMDWRPIFPESNIQVKVIKTPDNKYKKIIK